MHCGSNLADVNRSASDNVQEVSGAIGSVEAKLGDGGSDDSGEAFFCPVYQVRLCQLPNNGLSPNLPRRVNLSRRKFSKGIFEIFPFRSHLPLKPSN